MLEDRTLIHLMTWFAMYCPSLIKSGEELSEDAQFALLRLEPKLCCGNPKDMVHRHDNYNLFACSPISLAQSMVKSFVKGLVNCHLGRGLSNGWSASDHLIYCTVAVTYVSWSLICPTSLLDSSDMTNYMSAIPILAWGIPAA